MTRSGISVDAWSEAAFGTDGFYVRQDTHPARHFRTSSHVGGPLIDVLVDLAGEVDQRLGHPGVFDLVDVGAGDGELLTAITAALQVKRPDFAERVRPLAIDLRPRPADLNPAIKWIQGSAPGCVPQRLTGLAVAFELLDDIPCRLGPGATGVERTAFAEALTRCVTAGMLVFVDYAANASDAALSAYRDGRQMAPTADGSTNLTAPVDMQAIAAKLACLGDVSLQRQDVVLSGYDKADTSSELARLKRTGSFAELTDSDGLGAHMWLQLRVAGGTNR